MAPQFIAQLKSLLAGSDARLRKEWARQIADRQILLENLLSLLHGDTKTAQRFSWLISDIGEIDPELLVPCMPVLFSLRNQMPFPGMQRGVAKWLLLTNVPASIEKEAIEQLLDWMKDPSACVASKSFSARVLTELALQGRLSKNVVKKTLRTQVDKINPAYSRRMRKLLERLSR